MANRRTMGFVIGGTAAALAVMMLTTGNAEQRSTLVGQYRAAPAYAEPAAVDASAPTAVTTSYATVNAVAPAGPRSIPNGKWKRGLGPFSVELEGRGNTLAGVFRTPADEDNPNLTLDVEFLVECSMTSDGLLYGVIQSADVDFSGNVPPDALGDVLQMKMYATQLIDLPIAARCRVDGDVLTIKSFTMGLPGNPAAGEGALDPDELKHVQMMFVGRYKTANED